MSVFRDLRGVNGFHPRSDPLLRRFHNLVVIAGSAAQAPTPSRLLSTSVS